MQKKVLVIIPWEAEDITELDQMKAEIIRRGHDLEVVLGREYLTEDELIDVWQGVSSYVCGTDYVTRKALENAPSLEHIARVGVGFESVDLAAATDCGILVTTTPGAGAESVAEYAFALMIAVARRMPTGQKLLRNGEWTHTHGHSLYRKTLGVVGLGEIGRMLAKIVSGFDMKIAAYDIHMDNDYAKANNITVCSSLDELLEQSDFISINVPKNKDTIDMISAKEFKKMKKTAIIVNTARGGIVNEKDLYEAVRDGEIAGAGLDVLSVEPMLDTTNPLLSHDNILVTPHNAGSAFEGRNRVIWAALDDALDFLDGKKLPERDIRNPDVLAKLKRDTMRS